MNVDRRGFLASGSSSMFAASVATRVKAQVGGRRVRRIATEEAFATPELVAAWLDFAKRSPGSTLDVPTGISFIFGDAGAGSTPARYQRQLLDLGDERLREMDEAGVDVQLLSVTSPGVQVFGPERGAALAVATNDYLAAAIARHPTRFSGLACFAPQAPEAAAKEMERAISKLRLNGFIVNSHTNDLYLDDPRFFPILEAAEALDRPIYIVARRSG